MAKTAGIINTTLMAWHFGTSGSNTKVAHSTDASISIQHSPRDTTSKDSGGHRTLLEGLRQVDGSVTFYYLSDHSAAYTLQDFIEDLYVNRNTIYAAFKTSNVDDTTFGGDIYWNSIEISSADSEDNVAVTLSFSFTGALTITNT